MAFKHWSEIDMRALYDWQAKRRELMRALKSHGTDESKAAELGISKTNLSTLLWRARQRFDEDPAPAGVYADIRRENLRRAALKPT